MDKATTYLLLGTGALVLVAARNNQGDAAVMAPASGSRSGTQSGRVSLPFYVTGSIDGGGAGGSSSSGVFSPGVPGLTPGIVPQFPGNEGSVAASRDPNVGLTPGLIADNPEAQRAMSYYGNIAPFGKVAQYGFKIVDAIVKAVRESGILGFTQPELQSFRENMDDPVGPRAARAPQAPQAPEPTPETVSPQASPEATHDLSPSAEIGATPSPATTSTGEPMGPENGGESAGIGGESNAGTGDRGGSYGGGGMGVD